MLCKGSVVYEEWQNERSTGAAFSQLTPNLSAAHLRGCRVGGGGGGG